MTLLNSKSASLILSVVLWLQGKAGSRALLQTLPTLPDPPYPATPISICGVGFCLGSTPIALKGVPRAHELYFRNYSANIEKSHT